MTDSLPLLLPTDDFWSRRANAQAHAFECAPYGIPTRMTANDPDVLRAAQSSARRYSTAAGEGSTSDPITIQIVVRQAADAPVPDDLPEQLVYSGVGEWITVAAGAWGHGFANLRTRSACIFLARALAEEVRLVSRYFIDHYVLNLALTEWAMLHASCVLDPGREHLILMVAAHNTGKSTTALHLLRAGYVFLSDGMALLRQDTGRWIVGGYPIGEVKLRDDVLAWFPEYSGETTRVREQQKTIVDLRAAHPNRVAEALIAPAQIHLCFVERRDRSDTQLTPADRADAAQMLSANTVFWNESAQLEHNTATLHHLLQTASLHRLFLGADPDGISTALNQLTNHPTNQPN
ncbi:MAG TPA: hypothetical protein VJG32_07195 [Anaerolineae bacterium]|nr:hypothetical protein [Anaerolineae bacterium]